MRWAPLADVFHSSTVPKRDDLSEIKGEFLASLNHEIRTPLSGILGMADLLLETPLTEEQRDYIDATRLCAENLLETLNLTLEFSALTANRVHLEETEFSLREILEGVAAEFTSKAESKGLRLIRTFDGDLPAAVGDAVRFRQLLCHLLSNAIKFTGTGEVELVASVGTSSGHTLPVTVAIRDTGIGIAPDQVRTIFDGFQRLESGLARSYTGLGLGLAVAQKLVSLLHGSITVESELGRGSTFFVHVPLRLPSETVRAEVLPHRIRGRILVVDDNSVAQTIASHVLRRHAFEVVCADHGLAALELASRSIFDLILLDLQMPGLDGFQTVERFRQLPRYGSTPIIAVTANCSTDDRDRCLRGGMQGFLPKPVPAKDLVLAVEKHLASRQSVG